MNRCFLLSLSQKWTCCIWTLANRGGEVFDRDSKMAPASTRNAGSHRWLQRLSAPSAPRRWTSEAVLGSSGSCLSPPCLSFLDSFSCRMRELWAWQECLWQVAVQMRGAGFHNKTLFMTGNRKLLLVGHIRPGPLPIFVNKALLAHSHIQSLYIIYGNFPTAKAELSSCHLQSLKCLVSGLFQKKFADPPLDNASFSLQLECHSRSSKSEISRFNDFIKDDILTNSEKNILKWIAHETLAALFFLSFL